MEILYKSQSAIVINKPVGVPSESDPSGDMDALRMTSQVLVDMGERGEVYAVHRLDRVVGGVLMLARSSGAAAVLSEEIRERRMIKDYFAVVEGRAEDHTTLTDLLYKDARQGKSFVTERKRAGVKEATLEYTLLDVVNTDAGPRSLIRVRLATGRHHQIRVQLSSRRLPLVGDGKYGSRDKGSKTPALFSCHLEMHRGKDNINVRLLPDLGSYPWSLFAAQKYLFD